MDLSTSYFGEDLLISRLLKPSTTGTYVDVGANDPIVGSNTYRLYVEGWSGLTIDPNPRFAPKFGKYRPRDIHVTAGVALNPGDLTYHSFDPDVFNTFCGEQAREIQALGKHKIGESSISCLPLASLLASHLPGRHIDILNVDCEGMDIETLESLDLTRNRPTAIVVEDYRRFIAFRDGTGPSEMDGYLRSHRYSPIAQSAWSAIFVANDWDHLIERSAAFDLDNFKRGFFPPIASA